MEDSQLWAYHYTNPRAVRSMRTGCDYWELGLLPRKRFMRLSLSRTEDPPALTDGIIEALLEPLPDAWIKPERHPNVGVYLFGDLCREDDSILLRFAINSTDQAYIWDRAIVEDVLYTSSDHLHGKPDPTRMRAALLEAYNTRIPALQYAGGFTLPQFGIWNPISVDRLEVVWTKPSDDLMAEVLVRTGNAHAVFPRVKPSIELTLDELVAGL